MEYLFCTGAFFFFSYCVVVAVKKAGQGSDKKPQATRPTANRPASRRLETSSDNTSGYASFSIDVSYGDLSRLSGPPKSSSECWIPVGREARISNRRVPGGMVYVGKNLPSAGSESQLEPALIDPSLPRVDDRPDAGGAGMGYWPSYSTIPPASRSGYLDWLEGGRSNPNAYIGYVFLFFYGLERRALLDSTRDANAQLELPAVRSEVTRLLDIYQSNGSFRKYATAFASTLDFIISRFQDAPLPLGFRSGFEVPLDIRYAVGSAAGSPLSSELAFAWATSDPQISLRTPARRCPIKFRELFRIRYEARYGAGFKLPTCKRTIRVEYRPASPSFAFAGGFSVSTDVPEVTALVGPRRKLSELVEEVTTSLDSYSRKIGKDQSKSDPLAAASALPPELIKSYAPPEIQALIQRLTAQLQNREIQLLPMTEVLGPWLQLDDQKLPKQDAVRAVSMLAHAGIGVEPDMRFGGSRIGAGDELAIFRLEPGDPEAPSSAYAAASLLLHLAAMIAAADGAVSEVEERQLQSHITSALHLEAGEQRRLSANVTWLLSNPPGLAGVKKRVESLSEQQRQAIGNFLVQVAAADGHIDPAEVRTLVKLFGVLGLDPGNVHLELHAIQAQVSQPDAPVSVRPARPTAPGTPIPQPVAPDREATSSAKLDMSLVEAKLQESVSVSALLTSIFSPDDDEEPELPTTDEPADNSPLDRAHRALLRDLSQQGSWSREEYESLADRHKLMPDGALDFLNELAWDNCDEAIAESSDPLAINLDVCRELLKL